ncbi:MAG: molybdopterin-dependent oxidoreductase [Gemmataceae bacterium]
MATVTINGAAVDIGDEKLNLVQAAKKAGVEIPSYCWHPALSVVASCRMCLVEVGEKKPDGTVAMQPRVVPACQTPAKDGTVMNTISEKAKYAQERTLESLLLNHPLDCPVCDKAGECMLQDFTFRYGRATTRMIEEKNTPPNKDYIGENVTLFTDRCIMCSRCVRFTREVAGTSELQILNRGHHAEIDIFPEEPLNNKLATNVVDLCPVGALCSKDFLYKQRVWFLKSQQSACADCSTGCSINVDSNKDIVYRLRPRDNPLAQGYFMCDEGRLDYEYVNAKERFQQPLSRVEGKLTPQPWEKLGPQIRSELVSLAKKKGDTIGAVLSPFLTVEEAYLLAKLMKSISPKARLYLGHVPIRGKDEQFPQDRHGNPTGPAKFTIRAEKCPNRRGIEAVLRQLHGEVVPFENAVRDAGNGTLQALYVTGGYSPNAGEWYQTAQLELLKKTPTLIVQDLMPSTLSAEAKYVIPASTWAEKDGVFVNHANLAQAIHWAVRPGWFGRTDGQIFADLMERRGLLNAEAIRKELAAEIPALAPLAGNIGEQGVKLR